MSYHLTNQQLLEIIDTVNKKLYNMISLRNHAAWNDHEAEEYYEYQCEQLREDYEMYNTMLMEKIENF